MKPDADSRPVMAVLIAVASGLYPLAVWWSLGRWPTWVVTAAVAVLAALRARGSHHVAWGSIALGASVLALLGLLTDAGWPARLYPVLVSLAMLAVFSLSLFRGMPVVERLARLQEPGLPPEGVAYTRR